MLCRRGIDGTRVGTLLLIALILGGMSLTQKAFARPEFLDAAKKTYSFKPGGTIAGASCSLCHTAAGPPALNLYGKSVRGELDKRHVQTVTPELLHALDAEDPDGDGFTNAEEFRADTLPGDPNSHPAGAPQHQATPGAKQTGSTSAEINPFDIKAALLAKHAQHPILIHFPIGLFVASFVFDLIARWKKKQALAVVGYYNLLGAAIMSIPAVITGLIAWQWQFGGVALQGNLRLHLIMAVTSSVLMWILWWKRSRKPEREVDTPYLILGLIALALIALTGHIGGILSGVVTS